VFTVSGKEITAWNRKEGCFNINASLTDEVVQVAATIPVVLLAGSS
jgi:hypothetical protein